MAIQIQLRRDTAANWTSVNPTLAEGEIGYELDTGKHKIGNGTDNWTTLTYDGGAVDSVNGYTGVVVLTAADVGAPAGSGTSTGTNTGDQTSIVGITGTISQFNTALTGDDFLTTALGASTYQPLDSDLTAIAAISPANDDVIQRKAGAWINRTPAQLKTDLVLVKGDVGLGNVDNTSDVNKPVSTAQAAADSAVAATAASDLATHIANTADPHAAAKYIKDTSTSTRAISAGDSSAASADGSTALGDHAIAAGLYSTAIGAYSGAASDNSSALGTYSAATAAGATAVGVSAYATHAGSVAVGFESETGRTTEFSVGKVGAERYVANVKNAVSAQDATTLSQVNSLIAAATPTTTLTGDVTGSGTGTFATTLATAQPSAHTWAGTQTFTVAPVFTDQAGSRTALALGTAATQNTGTSGATIPFANGTNTWANTQTFTVAPVFTDASGTRSALGLVIGTNVQAYDADLTTWAGITPGTGVGTALAVNVGTAGAFVVNGGALGTPSSGTATNLSGTAASLTAGTATALATARAIYGNNFDGTAALTQIIASTYGGTGNGFTKFTGPTTSEKTFTLPNANDTIACLGLAQTWTNQNTFAAGTITTSQPFSITQTFNAGAVSFTAFDVNVTNTASASTSTIANFRVGGTSILPILLTGALFPGGTSQTGLIPWTNTDMVVGTTSSYHFRFSPFSAGNSAPTLMGGASSVFGWSNAGGATNGLDTGFGRAAANAVVWSGTGIAASTVSRTEMNKRVTGIANATGTAVLTITIPNAAHSAQLYIEVCGSLGAGGAIGANEASATNAYTITLARTAGVNAVAAISTAVGSSAAAVAGAATVTCTAALSAVSGAVGASNTFTVNVTISRSGGSSTNHTCLVYAKLMNANATGITIA